MATTIELDNNKLPTRLVEIAPTPALNPALFDAIVRAAAAQPFNILRIGADITHDIHYNVQDGRIINFLRNNVCLPSGVGNACNTSATALDELITEDIVHVEKIETLMEDLIQNIPEIGGNTLTDFLIATSTPEGLADLCRTPNGVLSGCSTVVLDSYKHNPFVSKSNKQLLGNTGNETRWNYLHTLVGKIDGASKISKKNLGRMKYVDDSTSFDIPEFYPSMRHTYAQNDDGTYSVSIFNGAGAPIVTVSCVRGISVNAICEATGLDPIRGEGNVGSPITVDIHSGGSVVVNPIRSHVVLVKTLTDWAQIYYVSWLWHKFGIKGCLITIDKFCLRAAAWLKCPFVVFMRKELHEIYCFAPEARDNTTDRLSAIYRNIQKASEGDIATSISSLNNLKKSSFFGSGYNPYAYYIKKEIELLILKIRKTWININTDKIYLTGVYNPDKMRDILMKYKFLETKTFAAYVNDLTKNALDLTDKYESLHYNLESAISKWSNRESDSPTIKKILDIICSAIFTFYKDDTQAKIAAGVFLSYLDIRGNQDRINAALRVLDELGIESNPYTLGFTVAMKTHYAYDSHAVPIVGYQQLLYKRSPVPDGANTITIKLITSRNTPLPYFTSSSLINDIVVYKFPEDGPSLNIFLKIKQLIYEALAIEPSVVAAVSGNRVKNDITVRKIAKVSGMKGGGAALILHQQRGGNIDALQEYIYVNTNDISYYKKTGNGVSSIRPVTIAECVLEIMNRLIDYNDEDIYKESISGSRIDLSELFTNTGEINNFDRFFRNLYNYLVACVQDADETGSVAGNAYRQDLSEIKQLATAGASGIITPTQIYSQLIFYLFYSDGISNIFLNVTPLEDIRKLIKALSSYMVVNKVDLSYTARPIYSFDELLSPVDGSNVSHAILPIMSEGYDSVEVNTRGVEYNSISMPTFIPRIKFSKSPNVNTATKKRMKRLTNLSSIRKRNFLSKRRNMAGAEHKPLRLSGAPDKIVRMKSPYANTTGLFAPAGGSRHVSIRTKKTQKQRANGRTCGQRASGYLNRTGRISMKKSYALKQEAE